eukprot:gnl/MRDRNA2_/MRDRNA2_31331_c0_seq1.p1 gnl/MRDRNA2_/MRDRNA2_31331_c0~~gnl/MRDRNA2_/MRDRNA2_31331_c0_seq1.p1  ORF type:complete len:232 (+),score=31.94 gnl/MRDRNA2_/MRDRNA2_31331_c0_seq1:92-787(+)
MMGTQCFWAALLFQSTIWLPTHSANLGHVSGAVGADSMAENAVGRKMNLSEMRLRMKRSIQMGPKVKSTNVRSSRMERKKHRGVKALPAEHEEVTVFKHLDKNQDRKLIQEEFMPFVIKTGIQKSLIDFDKNKDHSISLNEFRDLWDYIIKKGDSLMDMIYMRYMNLFPHLFERGRKSIEKYVQNGGLPKVGDPIRDFKVRPLRITESNDTKLSDLISVGRPMVLNFGSCS